LQEHPYAEGVNSSRRSTPVRRQRGSVTRSRSSSASTNRLSGVHSRNCTTVSGRLTWSRRRRRPAEVHVLRQLKSHRVPRLRRYYAALRLPRSVGGRFGSPRCCLPQPQALVLGRGRAHLRLRGSRRSLLCGFLRSPLSLGRDKGLSGYRTIPLPARQGHTPRRMRKRLAH
jgi:hypothetical protein